MCQAGQWRSGETSSTGVNVTGTVKADKLEISGSEVDFTNLPTSDPAVSGRLWRDGTTVKISLG